MTRAAAHLQTALSGDPGSVEALERLANIHSHGRNWTGAADCMRRLLELDPPPQVKAKHTLALARITDEGFGDIGQAITLYRKALELMPGDRGHPRSPGHALRAHRLAVGAGDHAGAAGPAGLRREEGDRAQAAHRLALRALARRSAARHRHPAPGAGARPHPDRRLERARRAVRPRQRLHRAGHRGAPQHHPPRSHPRRQPARALPHVGIAAADRQGLLRGLAAGLPQAGQRHRGGVLRRGPQPAEQRPEGLRCSLPTW